MRTGIVVPFSTFISLTNRVLTLSNLTGEPDMALKCLFILANLRHTSFQGITVLRDKSHHAVNVAGSAEYRDRAFEMALICVDSFNVDDHNLQSLLSCSSTACLSIQCCISIAEDICPNLASIDGFVSLFLSRWRRLSLPTHPFLATSDSSPTKDGRCSAGYGRKRYYITPSVRPPHSNLFG